LPAEISSISLLKLFRQVFVGILEDLHHRRVDAGAETFDLFPGEHAVLGDLVHVLGDARLADPDQVLGAAQLAGRRAADLDMGLLADRLQLEHGVEGRHFQNPDVGHVEQIRDVADRRLADPAVVLFLRTPQKRNDRGGLAARRITVDQLLRPGEILAR
jgi:hypothetical protein